MVAGVLQTTGLPSATACEMFAMIWSVFSVPTLCQLEVLPVTARQAVAACPKSRLLKPPRCAAHAFSISITQSSGPIAERSPYCA